MIAAVMGSNSVQAWIFFKFSLSYCLSSVQNSDERQFSRVKFPFVTA